MYKSFIFLKLFFSSLQKYVIEKSLQCITVIMKRGTLDQTTSQNSLQNLLGNIHQLFASNDFNMVMVIVLKID